jgi:glycosidase
MKKIYIILLLIFSFELQAQLERVEPPFWWAEMNNPEVQILCYAKDISTYDVTVSEGKINKIERTENSNYLFVYWDTKDLKAGKYDFIFKQNDRQFTLAYELKQRKNESAQRQGFDASDVIYLLMPDRFANGNPDNDNVPEMAEKANRSFDGGRHGGDIQGIINHLDYLNDLGITTLWSTPLWEDNEPSYSYHGYASSDLYRIDPRYGSNQDYQKLSDELHRREMKLIMDYVTNHWGSKHWLIKDLPSKDWIHYWENGENGFKRSNYRMTTQFDKNATKTDAEACMNAWFDSTMPDMNQANPLLLKYMIQNAIWWIEFADLDGLRVDTYSYNDKNAIAIWTKAILDEYPNFNIVGEVWMHNQAQIAYWQKDSKIGAIEDYNSHLPTVMDFTLHDAIIEMFAENKQAWNKGMIRAYDNFSNDFLYADPMRLLVFAGNHDITRINTYYKGDLANYKLILTLILTTRGIPQLYYADEIGMQGNKEQYGDGNIRKDFPGGWQTDMQNAFSDSGRMINQKRYYNFTRRLLQWRKTSKAIHKGKFLHYVPKQNLYVYFRYTETEKVMVIINNNSSAQEIDWKDYQEGLGSKLQGKDIIANSIIKFEKPYTIAAKTAMIIEIK